MGDGLAVSAEGVFGFCGCELGNFAFVDFFCFFYAETCGVVVRVGLDESETRRTDGATERLG